MENSEASITRREMLKMAGLAAGAILLPGALAGCANSRQETASQSGSSAAWETSSSESSSASSAASAAATAGAVSGKTLVAVFSYTGNTMQVAEAIHERVESDLFTIEPATPYSTDYDTVVELARDEQRNDTAVPLANDVADFDSYDTIFVGYPLWWYHVPQVVKAFLQAHDFTGKTVVPFETHGGGGWSQSLGDFEAYAQGATLAEGFNLYEDTLSSHMGELEAWLEGLR